MGVSRTDIFSAKQNSMANLSKALGHPARIAILEYLAKVDSCICGDIVDHIHLAQPTVSQHLKEMKSAGLIKGSIEGKTICYCLDEKGIKLLRDYLQRIIIKLEKNNKPCY
ncbi:MAG: ArsR/SmtB family transcription factor [Flavobacteriales bacterium]